ncbi:GPALPP motif-containing protein 1 [Orchesella cincta]|uniref:GPALPP motif-containing protein 1 n=1 Tax=Orchesella cincta TaxID=48709 RepID=A0A1D2MY91_ORCCI|nr:GPALPP motif-containing protein 1 [Orchesella cincta]
MSDSESDDDYYGPALPPGFSQSTATKPEEKDAAASSGAHIGPTLPPHLRAKLIADAETKPEESSSVLEAEASNSVHDSGSESDSDIIGPLPPDHPKAHLNIPTSLPSTSEKEKPKREEWMLIPPKNRIIPGIGVGPRKFLTRAPEDSKMSDEEDDEEAFAREADAEIERKLIEDYDQKMDDMKKDFETKKRRGQSLLEIHQTELKKKKDTTEKAERKAFDRDTDLQISGMKEGDKQKYIEKSKELNTKFSRGSRKYL